MDSKLGFVASASYTPLTRHYFQHHDATTKSSRLGTYIKANKANAKVKSMSKARAMTMVLSYGEHDQLTEWLQSARSFAASVCNNNNNNSSSNKSKGHMVVMEASRNAEDLGSHLPWNWRCNSYESAVLATMVSPVGSDDIAAAIAMNWIKAKVRKMNDRKEEVGCPPLGVADHDSIFVPVCGGKVQIHCKLREPKVETELKAQAEQVEHKAAKRQNRTQSLMHSGESFKRTSVAELIHKPQGSVPKASSSSSPPPPSSAVVLLHGLCGSTYSWRHVDQELCELFHTNTLSFDRPPFGLSSRPSTAALKKGSPYNPYEIESQGRLTAEVMDSFKIDQGVLVAHSIGATAALEFAFAYPQRVKALVLVAPAVKFYAKNSQLLRNEIRALLNIPFVGRKIIEASVSKIFTCPKTFHSLVERNYFKTERVYSEEFVRNYLLPLLTEGFLAALAQCLRVLKTFNYNDLLRGSGENASRKESKNHRQVTWSASFPVLIVSGHHDKTIPQDQIYELADILQSLGSNVQHVQVKSSAHSPMEETPPEFLDILKNWVAENNLSNAA
eukprot:CAMPEP_0184697796 /NCGR_PEP_ID=MMETSP0313-20130426/4635_1 /TAXON_ID=2792 /ORGANISM="Porphyridium aerugineum, Strain SAG 1380-2" /LENGTH=557 /DNA_ID=CAMNT_0027156633 /DNA_START=325 /DNA_END=1998 /DNA_ORIENTATION=-